MLLQLSRGKFAMGPVMESCLGQTCYGPVVKWQVYYGASCLWASLLLGQLYWDKLCMGPDILWQVCYWASCRDKLAMRPVVLG